MLCSMRRDLYYEALHLNVMYKAGCLYNRTSPRWVKGTPSASIDWVWLVELGRRATPDEIKLLCRDGSLIPVDIPT